jgi:hypothetical protein
MAWIKGLTGFSLAFFCVRSSISCKDWLSLDLIMDAPVYTG